jgi:hypothetical protein
VAALHYRDENGERRPLVSESDLYFEAPNQRPVPQRASPLWSRALIPGFLLGIPAAVLGILILLGTGSSVSKRSWTLYGIYSAIVGLILGVPGGALLFMSTFTDHTVTYANENLFLANPLALAAVPLGLMAAFGRRRTNRRLLQLFWFLLAGIAVVYLLLKIFPFFDQSNGAALAAILPVLSALAAAGGLAWKGVDRPDRV